MITIIDSIMGSGKTRHIINSINSIHQEDQIRAFDTDYCPRRFLVIALLLDEVKRYRDNCPGLNFKDPQKVAGSKSRHLEILIREGHNVVSTHSLFRRLSREVVALLEQSNYVLIIDEALDCVTLFDQMSTFDRDLLFGQNFVSIDPATDRLSWNMDDYGDYTGNFGTIKDLCLNGNLVCRNGSTILWEFPSEFLKVFKEVFILTYLFKGSPMSAYLETADLSYQMKAIQHGSLIDHRDVDATAIKAELRSRITIYEGTMNSIGDSKPRTQPLSSTWWKKQEPAVLKGLQSSTRRYFEAHAGTRSNQNMWTCYMAHKRALSGRGYTRGFVPLNTKATNAFAHKASLAYLCNLFPHPMVKGYFMDKGIPFDDDLYALSEMIQWIWRSQIREDKPISLFIPSERMRGLLQDWLAG